MLPGTGDPTTDIGAPLLGILGGVGAGMIQRIIGGMPAPTRVQRMAGGAVLGLVALAWSIALTS